MKVKLDKDEVPDEIRHEDIYKGEEYHSDNQIVVVENMGPGTEYYFKENKGGTWNQPNRSTMFTDAEINPRTDDVYFDFKDITVAVVDISIVDDGIVETIRRLTEDG